MGRKTATDKSLRCYRERPTRYPMWYFLSPVATRGRDGGAAGKTPAVVRREEAGEAATLDAAGLAAGAAGAAAGIRRPLIGAAATVALMSIAGGIEGPATGPVCGVNAIVVAKR